MTYQQIAGIISEDTTWSGEVLLTGSVKVTNGSILTIAPGTQVVAETSGEYKKGIIIDSDSFLIASSDDEKIIFKSDNGQTGSWSGIDFQGNNASDSSSGSVLKGVEIKDSINAVTVNDQGILIEDSAFEGNETSIYLKNTNGVKISGSTFRDANFGINTPYETDGYGPHINTEITNNLFEGRGTAIALWPNQRNVDNLVVTNNKITDTHSEGIRVGGGGYGSHLGNIEISQNDISAVNGISIDAYSWTNIDTPGLAITKNALTGDGVAISFGHVDWMRQGNIEVTENEFKGSKTAILYTASNSFSEDTHINIHGNKFTLVETAIDMPGVGVNAKSNEFTKTSGYVLKNASSNTVFEENTIKQFDGNSIFHTRDTSDLNTPIQLSTNHIDGKSMEADLADDGAEHFLYKRILADFSVIPTVEPEPSPYPTINTDTTPPIPQSLELSTNKVDLSNGDVTVSATTRLTDELSGFGDDNSVNAEIRWRSPSEQQFVDASFFAYSSGDDNDATFNNSYPITFNANAENGIWNIEYFRVVDEAGNEKRFYSDELKNMGIETTIEVAGASDGSDTTPPIPQSLELSTNKVDLSNGDVTVSATTRLIDDISGIGDANSLSAEVRWRSPSGNQFVDASFFAYRDGNDNDATFENSYPITFNANAETGTWTIENFYTIDKAGNSKWYNSDELIDLGINTTINITNASPSDTTAPVPQSLELSSTNIDLSKGDVSISATTRLIDDISGIGDANSLNAEVRWRSPSGNQFVDASFFAYRDGNDNDATFENSYPITFNANAETGTWTIENFYTIDKAGNSKWYNSDELIDLGINTTIDVNRKTPALETKSIHQGNSIYTIVEGPTWQEAENNSNKLGGHLVTINDAEENEFLTSNFSSYKSKSSGGPDFWIGYSDSKEESKWTWADEEISTYTNWLNGNPSNRIGSYPTYDSQYKSDQYWLGNQAPADPEGSDYVVFNAQHGMWQALPPNHRDGSIGIAEIPFIRRGDSAYVIVEGPTWEEAEANAVALGGHLVTINDAEENNWLVQSYYGKDLLSERIENKSAWIGYNDIKDEGNWEWSSGETSNYKNWGPGEPDGRETYKAGEEYAEFLLFNSYNRDPGQWADNANNANRVGIAEIPLNPPNALNNPQSNITLATNIYSVSAAEAGDLSQALTFNDGAQTLNKYIKTNGPISTDVTSNNSAADVFAVKQDNAADGDNYYVLDVDTKANGDYNINSYDISLGYDKDLFEVLDVGINGEFNFFNSAVVDSDNGTVRVVGGSAEELGDGLGGGTADGNTFQLLLKAKHNDTHNSRETVNAAFTAKVNSTDTVLVDGENIINGTSELLTSNYSFANSFVDFEASNNIAFATERTIGISDGQQQYTSLLREGSDLDSLGTFDVSTLGNITAAYQASIQQTSTDIYTVDFIEGQSVDLDQVQGNASHVDGSINSYQLRLSVEGSAGDIIDLSQTSIKVSDQVDSDKYVETSDLAGKNLITYQSDINYDGRVSMMDLAYLNAGAGQANDASINDVDVNYDKVIDLNDLQKMDEQWGNSLHTNNTISNDKFTGNNGTISLSDIQIADEGNADNSTFISQNETENIDGFLGTLAGAGSAEYSNIESHEDNVPPSDQDQNDTIIF